MKIIVCIVCLLVSYSIFAQADSLTVSSVKSHSFYVGFRGASIVGYRSLVNTDNGEWNPMIIGLRNDMEQAKISYSGDVFAGFVLNPKWSLELGVGFTNRGYRTGKLDVKTSNYLEDGLLTGRITTHDYYLDIPIRVNFMAGKKSVKLLTSAGLITGLFITETSTMIVKGTDYNESSTIEPYYISDFEKVNLFASGSVGIDWQMHPMWHLRSEAFFQYGLLKIIDAPVSARLYNGGISVGIIRQI